MMRRYLPALVLAACVISCGTTATTAAYRTIGSIKIAVDGGMQFYAAAVVNGQISPADQAKVKAAFQAYTAAAGAAAAAMRASANPAPPDLTAAADALLNLLAALGVKVTPVTVGTLGTWQIMPDAPSGALWARWSLERGVSR